MTATKNNTAVSVRQSYDDDQLGKLATWSDASALLAETGVTVEDVSAYGSGFAVLKDKDKLINVPFVVLEWGWHKGDNAEFVSALIMTRNDEKLILNDGSTGISAQLHRVTNVRLAAGVAPTDAQRGLLVRNGVTRSDYTTQVVDRETGEEVDTAATTYYLAD